MRLSKKKRNQVREQEGVAVKVFQTPRPNKPGSITDACGLPVGILKQCSHLLLKDWFLKNFDKCQHITVKKDNGCKTGWNEDQNCTNNGRKSFTPDPLPYFFIITRVGISTTATTAMAVVGPLSGRDALHQRIAVF